MAATGEHPERHLASYSGLMQADAKRSTRTDEEVRTQLLGQAVKFVDVAFSVADMNAARRIAELLDRLPQIVEPAHAFLFLDWNPGRIDLLLQRGRSLELGACPHLGGR